MRFNKKKSWSSVIIKLLLYHSPLPPAHLPHPCSPPLLPYANIQVVRTVFSYKNDRFKTFYIYSVKKMLELDIL